jgi:general secretion pathway protein M
MNQLKATLVETFTQFWNARSERDRQILTVVTLLVIFVTIYLIAIEPALTGRDELRKSLPILHQQAAEMQHMAQELASIPSADSRHEVDRDLVETEFSSNGLKAQTLSVNDGIVRAQFSSATMSSLQTCLLDLQKSSGLFADEVKITGLDGGMVSASFTLRQAGLAGSN